jgi:hypothetical protein
MRILNQGALDLFTQQGASFDLHLIIRGCHRSCILSGFHAKPANRPHLRIEHF